MKTAAKVFLILTLIGSIISMAYMFLLGFTLSLDNLDLYLDPEVPYTEEQLMLTFNIIKGMFIAIGCYFILPIILTSLSLRKLSAAKSKNQLIALGVLNILFSGLIAGILMLLIKDSDLNKTKTSEIKNV